MMLTKFTHGWVAWMLLILTCAGCKKLDYDSGIAPFGDVFFLSRSVASDLGVKIGGTPVLWQNGTGKISVPQGEHTFVFYDKVSGVDLGQKTVNVVVGSPETFALFQPTEDDRVAFLDPNGQDNEEAAPEGFLKIKIANYAANLIPRDLDVVVLGLNINMETVELATLENVGNNIGEEEYRQVPTGGSDILAYTFKFRDRNTQAFVKAHGGDDYWSQNFFVYPDAISPYPEKRLYTVYLRSVEQWGEYPLFIKSGDKYYEVAPEILFAD